MPASGPVVGKKADSLYHSIEKAEWIMTPSGGQPPGSSGGRGDGGKPPAKPGQARHAHDEFEVDIDVDTDMTRIASEAPIPSLFDDDEDEATQEISVAQLEEQLRPKSDAEVAVPISVESEALPIFMPAQARPRAPLPPPPLTPPLAGSEREADLTQPDQAQPAPPDLSSMPDLSDMLDEAPELPAIQNRMSPSADDLFNDVSDINDIPPIHDLNLPSKASEPLVDLPPVPAPPPTTTGESKKKARFGTGFTSGMQPLNVAQFEPPDPADQGQAPAKKRRGRKVRNGPAPMAGSKRVKRRWFQFGLRDVLLVLLIVLIAVGIFVGWSIYQDLKKQRDWKAFDQGRQQMEQVRTEAIERTAPNKEQDDP